MRNSINKLRRIIQLVNSVEERKSNFKIFSELIKNYIKDKSFQDYLLLSLHKKGVDYSDYLTRKEFSDIHNELNAKYLRVLLEDKNVFDDFFRGKDFPIIPFFASIEKEHIFWKDNQTVEPLINIQNYELDCFCKMHVGFGGEGVFRLNIKNGELFINSIKCTYNDFVNKTKGHMFVLQRTITNQHPDITEIHPSSINTTRIYTISNGVNQQFFNSFLRIGVGNSVIDNVRSGNLFIGIHPDGRLFEKASKYGWDLKELTHHPDTKVCFKDRIIPYYKEAIELTIQMHSLLRYFFIIGWDVVITDDGVRILEGNPVGDLLCKQYLHGTCRKEFITYANQFRQFQTNKNF